MENIRQQDNQEPTTPPDKPLTKEFVEAWCKAQLNVDHSYKDKTGQYGGYASVESVITATKQAFCEEGIMYFQHQRPHDKGVMIQTSFYGHGSELHSGWFFVPAENLSPQKFGGALTYARRYSLSTSCGIGSDDDDAKAIQDDFEESQSKPKAKPKAKAKTNGKAPQIDWYTDLIDQLPNLDIKELDKVPTKLQKPIIKLAFENTAEKAEKARLAIKEIEGWKDHSLLLVNIKEEMDKNFGVQA